MDYYSTNWKARHKYYSVDSGVIVLWDDNKCDYYADIEKEWRDSLELPYSERQWRRIFELESLAEKLNTFLDKEEIRDKVDMFAIVESYGVPLRRFNGNAMAKCVFHKDKTASLSLSKAKKVFHCFGCGESGDVFSFVMKIDGVTFPKAVEIVSSFL